MSSMVVRTIENGIWSKSASVSEAPRDEIM
jgi:hypothetical protein